MLARHRRPARRARGQIEVWLERRLARGARPRSSAHALLDLLASNYVRLRLARLFLVMQAVEHDRRDHVDLRRRAATTRSTSGTLFALLGRFLWQPGKTLERARPGPSRARSGLDIDGLRRAGGGVRVLAVIDYEEGRQVRHGHPLRLGWPRHRHRLARDARRASDIIVQPHDRPSRSPARATDVERRPSEQGRIVRSRPRFARDQGGPALFLALGGNGRAQHRRSARTWTFYVKADGARPSLVACSASAPTSGRRASRRRLQFSVGSRQPARAPGRPAPPSRALVPVANGTRLEIGRLDFALSLDCAGRRACCTVADRRCRHRRRRQRRLHRPAARRRADASPVQLRLRLFELEGLILEGERRRSAVHQHEPASRRVARLGQRAGRRSSRRQSPRRAAPIGPAWTRSTKSSCGSRAARRKPAGGDEADSRSRSTPPSARSSGRSTSRVDRLGVRVAVDHGKPPEQREPPLRRPRTSASSRRAASPSTSRPSFVTGGGSIFHDPAQGIYFGTLDLALPRRPDAEGDRPGRDARSRRQERASRSSSSSRSRLASRSRSAWASPRGIGGMLAINRTFDEIAMRAALPTGSCGTCCSRPIRCTT